MPNVAQEEPDNDMKGFVVPLVSLASTFVFGTQRFSVAIVNFVFLMLSELCIIYGLLAMRGLRCAGLALGFFLMAQTHYYYCGGINDMRFDYAGMVTMGLTYISALRFLETRTKKFFILTCAALALATYTRSIVLIYWIGALSLTSAYVLLIPKVRKKTQFSRELVVAIIGLTTASFALLAMYIGIYWHDFFGYYVKCKVGGEDLMRLRESGVNSLLERLTYYPGSFYDHFQRILYGFLICAPIAWCMKVRGNDYADDGSPLASTAPIHILTASLFISVFACVTYYAPTPVVIGVLAMPLAVWCALVLDSILKGSAKTRLSFVMVALVVLTGGYVYVKEMTRPTYPPHPDRTNSLVTEQVLADLNKELMATNNGSPKTIYWCLIHDGINQVYFEISQMEHLGHPAPLRITHKVLKAFPASSLKTITDKVDLADYVVISKLPAPSTFEYDGATSVRLNFSKITDKLNSEFNLVSNHDYHPVGYPTVGQVRIYKRRITASESNVNERFARNTDSIQHKVQ